jgi:hypothetical protein
LTAILQKMSNNVTGLCDQRETETFTPQEWHRWK